MWLSINIDSFLELIMGAYQFLDSHSERIYSNLRHTPKHYNRDNTISTLWRH